MTRISRSTPSPSTHGRPGKLDVRREAWPGRGRPRMSPAGGPGAQAAARGGSATGWTRCWTPCGPPIPTSTSTSSGPAPRPASGSTAYGRVELDAPLHPGRKSASGLELVPVWQDPLVVAVPAGGPVAGWTRWRARRSQDLPVADRVAPAERTPRRCGDDGMHGGLVRADPLTHPCHGDPGHLGRQICTGAGWTVVYAAHARTLDREKVVIRALAPPGLEMTTYPCRAGGAVVAGARRASPSLRHRRAHRSPLVIAAAARAALFARHGDLTLGGA